MRRIGRYRRKKQRRLLIISSLSLLLFLCVGYAAFSTNLSLKAKGNIKCNPMTVDDLKELVVTSGDGLYKSNYEDKVYYYAGANPNNYILFNDELWRIIDIRENNKIKIIRDIPLDNAINFDSSNGRFSVNGYCSYENSEGNNGCNLWGGNNTTFDKVGNPLTVFSYRTDNMNLVLNGPDDISYLNNYLNNIYLNSIGNDKKFIVQDYYDCGLLPTLIQSSYYSIQSLHDSSMQRRTDNSFYVGIPKVYNYILASTYKGCGMDNYYVNESCTKAAAKENWMYDEIYDFWTINPTEYAKYIDGNTYYYTQKVAAVSHITGGFIQVNAYSSIPTTYVKPTLFLNSNINLCGQGTKKNPYFIMD